MTLILVWQRDEQPQDHEQQQEEKEEQTYFERVIVNRDNNEEEQAGNNIEDAERVELPRDELTEEDQDHRARKPYPFITTSERTKRKVSQG